MSVTRSWRPEPAATSEPIRSGATAAAIEMEGSSGSFGRCRYRASGSSLHIPPVVASEVLHHRHDDVEAGRRASPQYWSALRAPATKFRMAPPFGRARAMRSPAPSEKRRCYTFCYTAERLAGLVSGRETPKAAQPRGFWRRVILAAAAVMVAVFFTFALSGPLPPKEMGVILGVAVLLDALLVRLILIPVALRLLGRWAWWLPQWADRLLPDVTFGHS